MVARAARPRLKGLESVSLVARFRPGREGVLGAASIRTGQGGVKVVESKLWNHWNHHNLDPPSTARPDQYCACNRGGAEAH
jgi:hypothetical protein